MACRESLISQQVMFMFPELAANGISKKINATKYLTCRKRKITIKSYHLT